MQLNEDGNQGTELSSEPVQFTYTVTSDNDAPIINGQDDITYDEDCSQAGEGTCNDADAIIFTLDLDMLDFSDVEDDGNNQSPTLHIDVDAIPPDSAPA